MPVDLFFLRHAYVYANATIAVFPTLRIFRFIKLIAIPQLNYRDRITTGLNNRGSNN